MDYILKRNNIYYYDRFIPKSIRPFVPKQRVRISLFTDSLKEARKRAAIQNAKTENYWKTLIDTGETYSHQHYKQVVARSQHLGFSYYPIAELIAKPLEELIERLLDAKKNGLTPAHVEAVCGGVPTPIIKLSNALPRFWSVTKDRLIHKTKNQQRKWRNPREKAWRNFLGSIPNPNKPIHELTRDDILVFRDWQMNRIEAGEIVAASANIDLKHTRSIITTVADNSKIRLDETHLFKRLELDESDSLKRQKTVFPEGFFYDPENHKCLTVKLNEFVRESAFLARVSTENKKENFQVYLENSLSGSEKGS